MTNVSVTFKLKVGDEPEDELVVTIQAPDEKIGELRDEWSALKADMPTILKEYELEGVVKQ